VTSFSGYRITAQAIQLCRKVASLPAAGAYVGEPVVEESTGATYEWSGSAWTPKGQAAPGVIAPRRVVGVTIDGQGSPPTVGVIGYAVVPFNGIIDQWHVTADTAGSCVVDVWKAASAIPTVANTIAGTEKPTLTAAQLASDTTLTTWTTAVSSGDVFGFKLDSVTTCTRITVEVRISESA
jgi:hypothetical protein